MFPCHVNIGNVRPELVYKKELVCSPFRIYAESSRIVALPIEKVLFNYICTDIKNYDTYV